MDHKHTTRKNKRKEPIDVAVLCGGQGTRLRSVVSDRPKVLAFVGGKPFLDHLLERLFSFGLGGRIILCVGYLRQKVVEHVQMLSESDPRYRNIIFSEEGEPMGTGGAIKFASHLVRSNDFIVVNGDTFNDVDLRGLHVFHKDRKSALSIAVVKNNKQDQGKIDADPSGRISGFRERSAAPASFMNTGVYMMNKKILSEMPAGQFSLENDFFPKVVEALPCHAYITDGGIHDIGTPERYAKAQKKFYS